MTMTDNTNDQHSGADMYDAVRRGKADLRQQRAHDRGEVWKVDSFESSAVELAQLRRENMRLWALLARLVAPPPVSIGNYCRYCTGTIHEHEENCAWACANAALKGDNNE